MAVGQHNGSGGGVPAAGRETARRASLEVSRRTLLGAVCASPLLSPVIPGGTPSKYYFDGNPQAGTPTRPAPSPSPWDPGLRRDDEQPSAVLKWHRALARFEAAEAAIAAVAGAPDHVYDPVGARHHSALARLLRTPAPDLAALARKLDLALDERTGEFDGDSRAMKVLKQDARRLADSA